VAAAAVDRAEQEGGRNKQHATGLQQNMLPPAALVGGKYTSEHADLTQSMLPLITKASLVRGPKKTSWCLQT
jgi:hypothetical protein